MTPAILFIVYKRPMQTRLVFEEIRKAKPKKLFIAGDGPKKGNQDDFNKVEEVRNIFDTIDWDCDLKTLFFSENQGSKVTESSAIDFFFSNVDEGIILEDDCLPNESFFKFCATLLEKYRDNQRIMHIGGNNFLPESSGTGPSYYFSVHAHGWGWATWKRAWKNYDVAMLDFPNFKKSRPREGLFADYKMRKYYLEIFDKVHRGLVDCWDYQWSFAISKANGLAIVPSVNLVTNIGFGIDGTYCTDESHPASNIKTKIIENIKHPESIEINYDADKFVFYKYMHTPWKIKIKNKTNSILNKLRKLYEQ